MIMRAPLFALLLTVALVAACSDDDEPSGGVDAGMQDDSFDDDVSEDDSDDIDDDTPEDAAADDDVDDVDNIDDDADDLDAGGLDAGADDAGADDAGEPGDAAPPPLDLDLLRAIPYPDAPYPDENPHTAEKAMLGKILFWDEQLSSDDTVACGTCHRPAAGGADPRSEMAFAHLPGPDGEVGTNDDVQGSPGVIRCDSTGVQTGAAVQVTGRRAPSYLDAMFQLRLFWDGRAECAGPDCPSSSAFEDPDNPGVFAIRSGGALENQAVGPPLSDVEMACEQRTWADIHDKLSVATPLALAPEIPQNLQQFINDNSGSYPALFAAAFGEEQTSGPADEINTRRIAFAIATHERTLRSNETPWDRFNAGDDEALTPAQIRGLNLFRNKAECDSCHLPPLFTDGAFHFTGFYNAFLDPPVDADAPDTADRGRAAITGMPQHRGQQRTPTLRNLSLREAGGLLHNGGGLGASLRSVLETYSTGGLRDDPAIEPNIPKTVLDISLTESELDDLEDFLLNALTDPRVANEQPPFDRPKLSTE